MCGLHRIYPRAGITLYSFRAAFCERHAATLPIDKYCTSARNGDAQAGMLTDMRCSKDSEHEASVFQLSNTHAACVWLSPHRLLEVPDVRCRDTIRFGGVRARP
jgi:hypothetical protein